MVIGRFIDDYDWYVLPNVVANIAYRHVELSFRRNGGEFACE